MAHVFYIEIISAQDEHRYIMMGDDLVVGRSARHSGIVLDDPRVSRIHLRISRHPETGITITDLYSANGSTLDGHALPPGTPFHWLMGQQVQVGSTRLVLWYGDFDSLNK
jgi:pSer/pThr/pTyr-binding forkhead associated (FHA) protein